MTEFYVKVEPGSEQFEIDTSGVYPVVSVEAPARGGRANDELVRRLSDVLGCEVGIMSGHRSKRKKMVADLPEEDIFGKLGDYPG